MDSLQIGDTHWFENLFYLKTFHGMENQILLSSTSIYFTVDMHMDISHRPIFDK